MFFGESTHSLDSKNRVFVPKRFQDALTRTPDGTTVVFLCRGQDSCLFLFSEAGFARAQEELRMRVFGSQQMRAARRVFFANSARIELDSSGRLLIPEKLLRGVGIDKEVVMVGVGDRAEIWARDAWERYETENLPILDQTDGTFDDGDWTTRN